MRKCEIAVSRVSMILANLSFRRSRRLLASSQAFACSTTQRVEPNPDPVRLADLADERQDAVVPAKPAIIGAVIFGIGIEPGDSGADH
jgi:hypothetical protein